MLGHTYRFQVYNAAGVAATVAITGKRYKFDSAGALSFDAAASTEFASASVNNGAVGTGATRDNSTDKFIGGAFTVSVAIADGSPSGNVTIFLQKSTDAGVTWPDSQTGIPVAVIPFATIGTKLRNFSL